MDVVIHAPCSVSIPKSQLIEGYGHAYLNLLNILGYEPYAFPVADWLRRVHGLDGSWVVVSPIFWQAGHNDVILLACDQTLNCSEDELRQAYDVFSSFAIESGMRVYFHDPYIWLLQCDEMPPVHALPPSCLLNQSLFPFIQQLDSTLCWQRFITEIQMLFAQRLSHLPQLNGVWVWGGAPLQSASNRQLWLDSPERFDMAALLSNHVVTSGMISKDAILWLDRPTPDEYEQLTHQLPSASVNWYWDDIAYQTPKSSCLIRFVRYLLRKNNAY